jgi:aminopeptidase N
LIGGFCSNLNQFHAADGSGYAFLAQRIIEIDSLNPQVAARMLTPLTLWKRYETGRQKGMLTVLRDLAAQPKLSPDLSELIVKSI